MRKAKLISLVVALVLVASLGCTVFAATSPTVPGVTVTTGQTAASMDSAALKSAGVDVATTSEGGSVYKAAAEKIGLSGSDKLVGVYTFNIVGNDGTVSFTGLSSISKGDKVVAAHLMSNGQWEYVVGNVTGDGAVSFTFSGLSPVIIYKVAPATASGAPATSPSTGA